MAHVLIRHFNTLGVLIHRCLEGVNVNLDRLPVDPGRVINTRIPGNSFSVNHIKGHLWVTHLPALVTIISVPSWLNSSQSAFISNCTLMLATLGFFFTRDLFGVDDEEEEDEDEEEEEQLVVPGSPCAASEPEYGG